MPVTLVKSKWSSGNLIFYKPGSGAATGLAFGMDGSGLDVTCYGDTASCYAMWDQSEDQLKVVQTNAATTGVETSLSVTQTHTGIGASAEALSATLSANVLMGTYANALMGKINLQTAGKITGLAGVVCGEIDMPGGAIAGSVGTYAVYEAEINCPTSYTGVVPIDVFYINAWGATVTQFDTYGYLMDIQGVTSGSGKFWYANKSVPFDAYLRIRVGGTPYYIGVLAQQAAATS